MHVYMLLHTEQYYFLHCDLGTFKQPVETGGKSEGQH